MKRGAKQPFIVLTGLSGSGKSQAIRALEDLGYFCVDNLPTTLIPTLAKLSLRGGGDIEKVAIVVDVREGGFLSSFPKIFRKLRKMPRLNPVLIFLEASHAALVRRFSETRRPHPLAPDRSVSEGIRDERSRLNVIREMADTEIATAMEIDYRHSTDISGKHVYLLKDVVSTGVIETYLLQQLRQKNPTELKLVALVDRPELRTVALDVDYRAFEADHRGIFVGYGLELTGKHANLRYIGRV